MYYILVQENQYYIGHGQKNHWGGPNPVQSRTRTQTGLGTQPGKPRPKPTGFQPLKFVLWSGNLSSLKQIQDFCVILPYREDRTLLVVRLDTPEQAFVNTAPVAGFQGDAIFPRG